MRALALVAVTLLATVSLSSAAPSKRTITTACPPPYPPRSRCLTHDQLCAIERAHNANPFYGRKTWLGEDCA